MKNLSIVVLLTLVSLTACVKDPSSNNPPGGNEKKYPVSLSVNAWAQSHGDMYARKLSTESAFAREIDSLRGKIGYLLYRVWDANTQKGIRSIYQDIRRDTGFGHILDTLPAGRYIITLLASRDSVFPATATLAFRDQNGATDIFYKKMELSVTGPVSQAANLDRVVSKVHVTIKDRIPYDASKFSFSYGYETMSAHFDILIGQATNGSMMPWYDTKTIPIPDSLKGTSNFQFDVYQLNNGTVTTTIDIGCLDSTGKGIAAKGIQSVILNRNQVTYLSGNLFTNYPGGSDGVSVGVNDQWIKDSVKVNF